MKSTEAARAVAAGSPADGPEGTENESGYLITRLSAALRRALDVRLRVLGLNTAQYVVLRELGDATALSAAELARRAYVRPQAMAPIVAGLEERELLERSRHHHNRRVLEVRLTLKGNEVLAECTRHYEAVEDQLLGDISPAERAGFRGVLQACLANMDPPWYHRDDPGSAQKARARDASARQEATVPEAQERALHTELYHVWLERILQARDHQDVPLLALAWAEQDSDETQRLIHRLDRDLIRPLAARIETENPELRADMVAALLLGIGVFRLIAHKAPLDQAADSDITGLFDRAVQALIGISPEEGATPPPFP